MDPEQGNHSPKPAAPVSRRAERERRPVADRTDRAPPCILVLGLSGLLFTPTVGPLAALVLNPVAALWGWGHVRRARKQGREPSGMAVLGRNLGMLILLPGLLVLGFAFLLQATGL